MSCFWGDLVSTAQVCPGSGEPEFWVISNEVHGGGGAIILPNNAALASADGISSDSFRVSQYLTFARMLVVRAPDRSLISATADTGETGLESAVLAPSDVAQPGYTITHLNEEEPSNIWGGLPVYEGYYFNGGTVVLDAGGPRKLVVSFPASSSLYDYVAWSYTWG